MKAMKAMKAKKAMKVRGKAWQVLAGTRTKTSGGLTAGQLLKNKSGKVVSRKKSALGKKNKWSQAMAKARKALGVTGFVACGGKTAEGKALYAKTKSIFVS